MKEITYNPKQYRIEISFPFSFGMKNKVKEIPDAKFDWDERVWYLPPTKLHAKFATDFGKVNEFFIDKYILELSRINKTSNKKTRSKLFPYQKDGLDFLHASGGRALLCDSPGVGKTHQAIAYMEESAQSKVLVVCPASVCYMWQDRIEELLKGWSTVVVEGYTKKFNTKARVVICSYNVFTNRVYELKELGFTLVVYDEIHALSNMKSRRSKASRILMTDNIIGLSGTPFLNRPVELYPLLNLIQPHVWNNYWKYVHTFCGAKKDYFGHWDVKGASNLPELKKRVEHIMIRRTKDDVLKDLPDLTKNYLPYLPQEKSLAKTYQEAYEVAKSMPSNVSPRVRILEMRKVIGLMKVKPAIELAEDILVDSGKVVLFAIHKDVVAQLEEGLKKYNVVKIVGDTPQKDRNDIVNRFQSDPEVKVAIISEAGGEGINLYAASNLIFVEREWNPGKETQIMGRCFTKENMLYYLYSVEGGRKEMGITTIDKIKVGDEVYTHRGNFKPVTGVDSHHHRGLFCNISYTGWYEPMRCTHDHKFLVQRKDTEEISWLEAHKILPGDFLLFSKPVEHPRLERIYIEDKWRTHIESEKTSICLVDACNEVPEARGLCRVHYRDWLENGTDYPLEKRRSGKYKRMPDYIDVDNDFLFLLGWYLAEGWVAKKDEGTPVFAVCGHTDERSILERIGKTVEKFGMHWQIYQSKKSKAIELRAWNGEFARMFLDWFGTGAKNKKLPEFMLHLPPDQAKIVLDAYIEGDGYIRGNRVEWCSASKNLSYQMGVMASICGYAPTIAHNKQNHFIGAYTPTMQENNSQYIKHKVLKVLTEYSKETVYDISVQDDHSFTVGFATAHNCHRIGQTKPVSIYYIIAKNTIDERIHRLIEKKAEVLGQVYSFEDIPVNDLFDVGVN